MGKLLSLLFESLTLAKFLLIGGTEPGRATRPAEARRPLGIEVAAPARSSGAGTATAPPGGPLEREQRVLMTTAQKATPQGPPAIPYIVAESALYKEFVGPRLQLFQRQRLFRAACDLIELLERDGNCPSIVLGAGKRSSLKQALLKVSVKAHSCHVARLALAIAQEKCISFELVGADFDNRCPCTRHREDTGGIWSCRQASSGPKFETKPRLGGSRQDT